VQTFSFDIVVKDTPEAHVRAPRNRLTAKRFDSDVLLPSALNSTI